MSEQEIKLQIIGSAEPIVFPEINENNLFARIDTGARTSSIHGKVKKCADGSIDISFISTTKVYNFSDYKYVVVATSTGQKQQRYAIKLLVLLNGRRIRATFTIANRKSQVYPVLVGRNILKNKFIVDVNNNNGLVLKERLRVKQLQESLNEDSESREQ